MLQELEKAYVAGFLDGDGCIMFQLVRRKDYVYGFQIRASIVFFQKTLHRYHLEWIKEKLKYGYVRNRNDDMSEYTIVGINYVREILDQLGPYLRLKKPHVVLAFKIFEAIPKQFTPYTLWCVSELVDQFAKLNYSKKRTNTTEVLLDYFVELMDQPQIPVTTDS